MIPVYFEDWEDTAIVEDLVYQYDYGQVLAIHGLVDMPEITEVDFSVSEKGGTAYPITAITSDGITYAQIPDILLANEEVDYNYKIYAFVRTSDAESSETLRKIKVPVKSRPKNTDYVTPDEPDPFAVAIEMIRRYKDECESARSESSEIRNEVETIANSAMEHINNVAEEAVQQVTSIAEEVGARVTGETLTFNFG